MSSSPGFTLRIRAPQEFYGGLAIAAVAIVIAGATHNLLGSLFTIPFFDWRIVLTWPFVNALGHFFTFIGISIAATGLFPVRAPQDFYGGLALVGLALFALWAGSDLPGQHGFTFGPGTAPRMFAGLLAVVGVMVAIGGLMSDGPALGGFAVRGPALICAGILFFALAIRPLGLVITSYVTFMICILASNEMRWLESLIAAAVMTAFCVALFVYLLQLPFQLLPWFMI